MYVPTLMTVNIIHTVLVRIILRNFVPSNICGCTSPHDFSPLGDCNDIHWSRMSAKTLMCSLTAFRLYSLTINHCLLLLEDIKIVQTEQSLCLKINLIHDHNMYQYYITQVGHYIGVM